MACQPRPTRFAAGVRLMHLKHHRGLTLRPARRQQKGVTNKGPRRSDPQLTNSSRTKLSRGMRWYRCVFRPSYFTELRTEMLILRGNLFDKIFGGTVARADGTAPGQLTHQPVTETDSSKFRSNSRSSTIKQAHLCFAQNTELRLKRKFERDLRPPSARRTVMAGTSPVFTRSALQLRWTRLVTAGAAPAMVSVSTGRKRPRPRLGAVRIPGKILRRKEKII